jgi:hypothetical protein
MTMTIEEFRRIDATYRREEPKLFHLGTPDKPVSIEQIKDVELAIGVAFPESYRQFLHEFGGGAFGLLTVYSADPEGEWFLPTKLPEARTYLSNDLLPIADDFAGGYYILHVTDGVAAEPVFYWNTDGGVVATEFDTVLDFIARYAYE